MSINCNSFERRILGVLQHHMSKREAEMTLRDIRDDYMGDEYEMIRPEHRVYPDGSTREVYPSIHELIKDYI